MFASVIILKNPFLQRTTIAYELLITEWRYNQFYIIFYKNLATFILTLIVPLGLLAYYNVNTYRLMGQRKKDPAASNIALRLKQQVRFEGLKFFFH